MTLRSKSLRLQSWIKPDFACANLPNTFVIILRHDDRDIVEFISKGTFEVRFNGNKSIVAAMPALWRRNTLRGELHEAVRDIRKLRPFDWKALRNTNVTAYFVAAFLLQDETKLAIVATWSNSVVTKGWFPAECKEKADKLFRSHEIAVAAFDEEMLIKEKEDEELFGSGANFPYKDAAISLLAIDRKNQRPNLNPQEVLPLLPRGVTFDVRSGEQRALVKHGTAAIAASGLPLSRSGSYVAIVTAQPRPTSRGILTWNPHVGLPSYPEVRAAVQERVPSAFRRIRETAPGRPEFGLASESPEAALVFGHDLEDLSEALDEVQLDHPNAAIRAQKLREEVKTSGFEAIAWYQPYHVWTEETWGIYFDASKLDDFAYSIYEDLKASRLTASHSSSALLAFGLTQAHELFHARVEAASSWLELHISRGRHLRYSQGVYERLRETPEWLEEALANWNAWDWFKSDPVQSLISKRMAIGPRVDRLIEASLDLSPRGYSDWRKGFVLETWRTFVTQLTSGKPSLPLQGIGLPLDSVIKGPLPYDFRSSDIPLRFAGTGVIADRLLSRPASFNVPTRRELERALKHFKHASDPSAGKGGHQKWTGPDRRAFILPMRDPVSPVVFKTFLHHIGIDKATYVHEIRPNL